MIKVNFMPRLSWKYFVAWISIAQVITFLVCFIGSIISYSSLSTSNFLGANQKVYKPFDKDPYKV